MNILKNGTVVAEKEIRMRVILNFLLPLLGFVLLAGTVQAGPKVAESYGPGPKSFSLATGSPGELGLLKVLGEAYCAKAGCRLDWIKAGFPGAKCK